MIIFLSENEIKFNLILIASKNKQKKAINQTRQDKKSI